MKGKSAAAMLLSSSNLEARLLGLRRAEDEAFTAFHHCLLGSEVRLLWACATACTLCQSHFMQHSSRNPKKFTAL